MELRLFFVGCGSETRKVGSLQEAEGRRQEAVVSRQFAVGSSQPRIRVFWNRKVGLIGSGITVEQVLADYPYLEREDILQALRYAAWRAEERELTLTG